MSDTSDNVIAWVFWIGIIVAGFWWLGGDSDSSSTSVESYSSGGYYRDTNDYDPPEPDFDDYKEYIEADSVEACSSSGCYELDADVSGGEVETIYFDNGGYRELDAEFDEDGDGYGTGSDGDEWEVHVDESEIEAAKERYLEDQAGSYDYEDDDYYR